MRFGRRTSVRVHLTAALFLVVCLSWFLSAAATNYLAYRDVAAIRKYMLQHPEAYPQPIPEPRLGILALFAGPRSFFGPPPPPGQSRQAGPPPADEPERFRGDRPGRGGPPPAVRARDLALRTAIALALALGAGSWLSWRFTRPLTGLAEGARALCAGKFDTRVSETGSSEYHELASAMNEMAATVSAQIHELREEAARRKHLLADVAHELRGPVMTLRTMAGALADGIAADESRRSQAQDALVRSSDRMLRLVNDLLELARLDLRELPLHCRTVDVRHIAESAVASARPAAEQAGIVLTGPGAGEAVMADIDPDRIAEILENLLTNVVSYAGQGAECRVSIEGADPLRLTVADTGMGIAPEHLPYLFDAFYRADQTRSPSDNHTGLGLRIARGLAEAHGGSLTLDSAPGKGTTVIVSIPSG